MARLWWIALALAPCFMSWNLGRRSSVVQRQA